MLPFYIGSIFYENYCEGCILNPNKRKKEPIDYAMEKWKSYIKRLKKENKDKEYQGLFAYSGGKDSTLGLYITKKIFDKEGMKLLAFTIDNGFKGNDVWENINRVVDFVNVDWIKLDLKDLKRDEFFSYISKGEFPCDPVCRKLKDYGFMLMSKEYQIDSIITGGEILVNGSICTKKYSVPLCGSLAAYGYTDKEIEKLIEKYKIPWRNPGYSELDSDCIVPALVIGINTNWKTNITIEEILNNPKLSILYEYFSYLIEAGAISREEAIRKLTNPIPNNEYHTDVKRMGEIIKNWKKL
jgi:predicted PP-loop superfamily ATPase